MCTVYPCIHIYMYVCICTRMTVIVFLFIHIVYLLFVCAYVVIECRNLPPMDPNGLADPYVKVSMLDSEGRDKSSLKQKTERREKTLDPQFDESFFL